MKKMIAIIVLVSVGHEIIGQSQLSTYHFREVVPQASFLNPAFTSRYKVTVGFDFFAGLNTDNVTISDIVITNETTGNVTFDEDRFISGLRNQNNFESYLNGSFFVGVKVGKGYMTLAAGARSLSTAEYSEDFAIASFRGLDNEGFVLEGVSGDSYSTMEFSGSYAYPINERLTVGARFKYINGIVSADSEGLSGSVYAGSDSVFFVQAEDIRINTTGVDAIDDGNYDDLFFSENRGFGIDLGATYVLNDRVNLSASIVDLGRIRWEQETTQYFVEPAEYRFENFGDLLDLIRQDEEDGEGNLIDQEIDSLSELFDFEEMDGVSYTTRLFSRFYLGGEYHLGERHRFGATFYGQVFPDRFVPGLGLSYAINIGKFLDLMTGVSLIDGRVDNLNAGLSMQFPGLQIYAMSDNVLGAILPSRYSIVSAQVGVNFNFGKWNKREEASNTLFSINPYSEEKYDRKNIKKTKKKRQKLNDKQKQRPRAN